MYEELKNISESILHQFFACESIKNQVDELKTNTKIESKLKNRLDEMLKTSIADLLITADFILEVVTSIYDEEGYLNNETDLEFLLQTSDENFNEKVN